MISGPITTLYTCIEQVEVKTKNERRKKGKVQYVK